jgi:P pilus assembly chaperone PapD
MSFAGIAHAAAIALILSLASLQSALALAVSPLVIDMSTGGRDGRATFTVTNDQKTSVPVEIEIFRLELGVDGEKKRTPADDDFVVFPPQAILKAGASQIFRLQWAGDPELSKSNSYLVSVNQTPVKLPQDASGVQIVFNFSVIVNVAPPASQAKLEALRVDVRQDKTQTPRPAILVRNMGSRHAYLGEASLTLSAGNWKRTITAPEMRQFIGVGLVQPGAQRRFVLPVDLPPGASVVSAEIGAVSPANP